MKKLIPLAFLLFAAPLQSSPLAPSLQLAGEVELSNVSYEIVLDVRFKAEKAHTIQYEGVAQLTSTTRAQQEKPVTLYLTKKQNPRAIISILMTGNRQTEGYYLELVADLGRIKLTQGDVLHTDAELMWMIQPPNRDFSDTTFITRDRGEAHLEILELK